MRKFVRFVTGQRVSSSSPETRKVSSSRYEIKEKDLGKIHRAACSGDLAELKKLAEKNELNQLDKENRTPLHVACEKGHVAIVQFLVDSKVELNKYDHQKHSALMKAVQCQQERCALTLLKNKANPNLEDMNGNTALHLAASIPSIPLAKLLLRYKANIDAQNNNGCTPLALAVMEQHSGMAQLLLEEGADVNAGDHEQRTPLMMAASKGLVSLVSLLLLHNADVTVKDKTEKTADDHAICHGHLTCSRLIIKHGLSRQLQVSPSYLIPSNNKQMLGGQVNGDEKHFSLESRATIREVNANINCGSGDCWPSSDEKWLDLISKKAQNLNLSELMKTSEKSRLNGDCVELPESNPQLPCLEQPALGNHGDLSDWDSSSSESVDISAYSEVIPSEVGLLPLETKDDEECLLQQELEKDQQTQNCATKTAGHMSVHGLFEQLDAAKARVESLESEFHRTVISLSEKGLLLETVRQELHGTQAWLAELEMTLQGRQKQAPQADAYQKLMKDAMKQTQKKISRDVKMQDCEKTYREGPGGPESILKA